MEGTEGDGDGDGGELGPGEGEEGGGLEGDVPTDGVLGLGEGLGLGETLGLDPLDDGPENVTTSCGR